MDSQEKQPTDLIVEENKRVGLSNNIYGDKWNGEIKTEPFEQIDVKGENFDHSDCTSDRLSSTEQIEPEAKVHCEETVVKTENINESHDATPTEDMETHDLDCTLPWSGHCIKSDKRKKTFKCSMCEYAARCVSDLNRHMLKHRGKKPFNCNLCDYAAMDASDVRRHMQRHTGLMSYICDICGYGAKYASDLLRHKQKHTRESEYKCNTCDYTTSKVHDLREHLKTHEEKKPYQCNICEFSGSVYWDLKQHMKSHGRKRHRCNICNFTSATLTDLKKHMRTQHV